MKIPEALRTAEVKITYNTPCAKCGEFPTAVKPNYMFSYPGGWFFGVKLGTYCEECLTKATEN